MKGPSLDAIRKFKEQQERKKREEEERKIKEKLSTLEHRASQGDRKAKQELKKIEKFKEERNKPPEQSHLNQDKPQLLSGGEQRLQPGASKCKTATTRPPRVETDFEELMKLAKQNNNEIKKKEEPKHVASSKSITKKKEIFSSHKPKTPQPEADLKPKLCDRKDVPTRESQLQQQQKQKQERRQQQIDKKLDLDRRVQAHKRRDAFLNRIGHANDSRTSTYSQSTSGGIRRPPYPVGPSHLAYRGGRYGGYDEGDEDEEDDYEVDDFVVDDEELDVQDEVRKTIRSVFRYDRRRCDLREEELDRQYRAIGRVSTFEDLEREERRASRLAAAEDARALKEEEERKRLKKLRLQKS